MSRSSKFPSVMFVCTGNICRSPFAAGLYAYIADDPETRSASAGMAAVIDASADPICKELAEAHGFELNAHRARQIETLDYYRFDYLIALDLGHYDFLQATKPADCETQIQTLLSFSADCKAVEVPDPFGRKLKDYKRAVDLIEIGVRAMMTALK
ncbi:MAG: hypothetical protein AAF387_16315 [Pseudomonadota bacterium]